MTELLIPEKLTEPLAQALIERGLGRLTAKEVVAFLDALRATSSAALSIPVAGEREKIVSWLRDNATQVSFDYRQALRDAADAIESGGHLSPENSDA